jgi:hypothetical protein
MLISIYFNKKTQERYAYKHVLFLHSGQGYAYVELKSKSSYR